MTFWHCCLSGSRQSWATTFWRSMTGQTSCLHWLAPLMAPRFPSSCSAAATFFICCLPPTTADQMPVSSYCMRVSQQTKKQHFYAYRLETHYSSALLLRSQCIYQCPYCPLLLMYSLHPVCTHVLLIFVFILAYSYIPFTNIIIYISICL